MATEDKKIDTVQSDKVVDSEEKTDKEDEQIADKPADESILDTTVTHEDAPLVKKDPEPPKSPVHKKDFEDGMVYLYGTPRSPVIPSLNPFCLKVESWLRVAEIKYELVDHNMKLKSRKGQLPFIEVDGEEIADSAVIVKELSRRNAADLDADLTSQQRGVASCAIAMLENHFFWVIKAWRSKNPNQMLQAYKMDLQQITGKKWPKPILNFFYKCQAKKNTKAVISQGLGVHSAEEIDAFGQEDLHALTELLGEQNYFFGDSPSTLDIVAFANLAQLLFMDEEIKCPLSTWLKDNCQKLVEFCQRFKERVFPDWDELCTIKKKEDPKEEKKNGEVKEEATENKEEKPEKEKEAEKEKETEKEKEAENNEKGDLELKGSEEKQDEKKDEEKEDKNTTL